MSIDCCKSYVGKQIIGLLPSQTNCLYYSQPYSYGFVWYDETYVNPVNSFGPMPIYNVGVDAHNNGYPNFGFMPSIGFASNAIIWTLSPSEPIGWQGYDSSNTIWNDIVWNQVPVCDLSTSCYKASGTYDTSTPLTSWSIQNVLGYSLFPDYDITGVEFIRYLNGIFGAQCDITIEINQGLGTWEIIINNCYTFLAPTTIELGVNGLYLANFSEIPNCQLERCIYVYQYTSYDFNNYGEYYLNGVKIFDNQQGDGPLRNILVALDGNVVVPLPYISNTLFFYYIGTSPYNFTITDKFYNPIFTTDFKPISDVGNDCLGTCLIYTIPKTESTNDWIFNGFILFNDPPYGDEVNYTMAADTLNYLNPGIFPYYYNTTEMQAIVNLVFGPNAIYSYYDDATNIYIRFENIYDFSAVQLSFTEATTLESSTGDMTPCP